MVIKRKIVNITRLLTITFLFLFVVNTVFNVYTSTYFHTFADEELDEINRKINEAQKEKERREKELKSVNYSISSISSNLSYVSSRVKLAEQEIEAIKKEGEELDKLVEQMNEEVNEMEAEYLKVEEDHAKSVKDLYKMVNEHNDSAVYIFSAVTRIDEATFFTSIQNNLYIEVQNLQDKFSSLVESRELLDRSMVTLEEKEIELEQWQEYLAMQKAEYQNLLVAQQVERNRVANELKEVVAEIAILDAESQRIIAEKYPPPPSYGGGLGSKPVKSGAGYFKVTVKRLQNNK